MSRNDEPITPETKVGALLECWPELEPVLVAQSPAFAKLRNPILRRTVARVATLAQVAKIGGLDVRALVRTLRAAAGQSVDRPGTEGAPEAADDGPCPDWVDPGRVRLTVDADAILASGENPLQVVTRQVRGLGPGELLALRSTFRPQPLLDAFEKLGNRTWTHRTPDDGFETFVVRG
ncbi:MAG: DUF1858 domain-containing protein [Deltaproteobacteria bacterium]|nr:DUF1858 domain-containing protein [Deltaproteobacteria bacterium]